MTISITTEWPPGCYLLKLVGNGGEEQFVPLTVRDDTSKAAYVMQNSVTTWQAYNLYGEYSLYYGPTGKGGQNFANRARAVSFDRPYPQTWASGAADFVGNEFPLLFQLERLGADVTYWTDVDLHNQPQLLANHRCLFSMGHDEYWSTPMRDAAASAIAQGVNVAFLGANACYRQIRLQSTSVGPSRLQVCYKDATEDPIVAAATGADDGQLGPGPGQQSRIQPDRLHVPVRRRQGRLHRDGRLDLVLERLQPRATVTPFLRRSSASTTASFPPCPVRGTSTSWRTRPSPASRTGPT